MLYALRLLSIEILNTFVEPFVPVLRFLDQTAESLDNVGAMPNDESSDQAEADDGQHAEHERRGRPAGGKLYRRSLRRLVEVVMIGETDN